MFAPAVLIAGQDVVDVRRVAFANQKDEKHETHFHKGFDVPRLRRNKDTKRLGAFPVQMLQLLNGMVVGGAASILVKLDAAFNPPPGTPGITGDGRRLSEARLQGEVNIPLLLVDVASTLAAAFTTSMTGLTNSDFGNRARRIV